MNPERQPYHYEAYEDKQNIQELTKHIRHLIAEGATNAQVRYMLGEDEGNEYSKNEDSLRKNQRTITTYAYRELPKSPADYISVNIVTEPGYPDLFTIKFLSKLPQNDSLIYFAENSDYLIQNNQSCPTKVYNLYGSSLNFFVDKLKEFKAVLPNDTVQRATCFNIDEN